MARYNILRPATREEWLALRKEGIGSSEAGVIAGVSRFTTPVQLWRKKKGLVAPEPESPVMQAGHEFEPLVAYKYALVTGDVMDPASEGDWLAVSVDKPYLRVSPDRIFWKKSIPESRRDYSNAYIVECKTTKLNVTREDYPKSWFFQVQYQMGVMGIKEAVIAWFSSSDFMHFDYVTVRFNPVIYAELERLLTEFWTENVMGNRMPQLALTNEDAGAIWPEAADGEEAVADDELVDDVRLYNALSTQHSAIEKQMDEIKLKVKTFMKSASVLKNASGKTIATWKQSKVADGFDQARFIAENQELYKKYVKTGQTTRRITFRKSA